jgi:hypothetical protein
VNNSADLAWSSANADSMKYSCTGPIVVPAGTSVDTSGGPVAIPFTATGTEECTFIPYNGITAGPSCSASVVISATPPGPSCTVSFSPTSITIPGSSDISWSSADTDSMTAYCTGPSPMPLTPVDNSGGPLPVAISTSGTETCTLTPYSGAIEGTPCSASVYAGCECSLIVSGGQSCSLGTTCDGCNCVPVSACTGSIPSGSTMCSGDDAGLSSSLPWQYAGTSSVSCTIGRKCEYYTPPSCATWSLTLTANPSSGSAPLTSNITAQINAAVGGETYTYTNHNCGASGPVPTNISGGNFTCAYPSNGTYLPSVQATAQSTGCSNSASATVVVSAASTNCGGSIPAGFYRCTGTHDTGLISAKDWTQVATCTADGFCEYIPCPTVGTCTALPTCGPGVCGSFGQTCIPDPPPAGCTNVCTASSCTATINCSCNSGDWQEIAH